MTFSAAELRLLKLSDRITDSEDGRVPGARGRPRRPRQPWGRPKRLPDTPEQEHRRAQQRASYYRCKARRQQQ